MMESESIMPISLAGPNTCVVLAGDHMQVFSLKSLQSYALVPDLACLATYVSCLMLFRLPFGVIKP